ncbi:MAG: TrkA family potassium uptake protein, partial [Actinobacteria bacterium]|nr:TrkA family potassium uptake protein [Actinomycetota bacterium]
MKVVIVGGGSVGRFIAEQLASSGHSVTVLELEPATVRRRQQHDSGSSIEWREGDGCDLRVLSRIGLAECDVVAAVTGDDEDNLVVSLLAKQEFGVPRVVARVNNPNNEWMFNDMWGVDLSVSTPHLITGLVQEAVDVGSLVRLLSFDRGKAKLVEVTLAATSPAADRAIATLDLPRETTVVAVLRQDRVVVPHGDTVLRAADEVIVLITGDAEPKVRSVL